MTIAWTRTIFIPHVSLSPPDIFLHLSRCIQLESFLIGLYVQSFTKYSWSKKLKGVWPQPVCVNKTLFASDYHLQFVFFLIQLDGHGEEMCTSQCCQQKKIKLNWIYKWSYSSYFHTVCANEFCAWMLYTKKYLNLLKEVHFAFNLKNFILSLVGGGWRVFTEDTL